jgi:hypothetical protein
MEDLGGDNGDRVAENELKREIDRRLNDTDVKYLRDICDRSDNPVEEYSVPHKASSASCFCGLSSVSKRLY